MNSGISEPCPGSSPSRELWSYHSYSREPCSTGAWGFVQLIRRWNTGKRRNIPAASSSRERTATRLIRERSRKYAVCKPPGPLPTTQTSYDPGGYGRSGGVTRLLHAVGELRP